MYICVKYLLGLRSMYHVRLILAYLCSRTTDAHGAGVNGVPCFSVNVMALRTVYIIILYVLWLAASPVRNQQRPPRLRLIERSLHRVSTIPVIQTSVWIPVPYLALHKMRALAQECTALGGTLPHLLVWLARFFHELAEILPPP